MRQQSATTYVGPSKIYLMRHCEKPDHGLTLSTWGYIRSMAIVPWFINTFGMPDCIFAMQSGDVKHKTLRPVESVTPLASACGLPITIGYEYDQYQTLLQSLMTLQYQNKTILVCSEYEELTAMAKYLGVTNPPPWTSKIFDQVWIITFDINGTATLQTQLEDLLKG